MLKKLNSANAGVKRPLRVSDLQDIWNALGTLFTSDVSTDTIIVSGFNDKGNGYLSAGIAVKAGKLYYHPDVEGYRILIGGVVYGNEIDGVDVRVFDDTTEQDFSFNVVASTGTSAVVLGTFTLNFIAQRRKKQQVREVYGTLTFNPNFTVLPFSPADMTVTFTPDNVEDSDVTADIVELSEKYALISITDGNDERMRRFVEVTGEFNANMFAITGSLPSMYVGEPDKDYDLVITIDGTLPSLPYVDFDFKYRIKILFDV